ncbi:MAG: hypothetical protein ACE5ID_02705 [Acidobacteriota bacterium]
MDQASLQSETASPRLGVAGLVLWMMAAGTPPLAAPPDEASAGARERLEHLLESRGGEASFGQLREIRRIGTLVVAVPGGEESMPFELTVRPPGHVRLSIGEGQDLVLKVLDPVHAYEVHGTAPESALTPLSRRSLQRAVRLDEAFLPYRTLHGSLEAVGVEEAGPGQLPAELVAAAGLAVKIREPDGSEIRLVLPPEGGLPRRVDYQARGEDGKMIPTSDVFRDWRVVDGMLFPFEVMLFVEQRGLMMVRYDKIEVDLASPVR